MRWHQRFFWLLLLFLPTQLGVHFWPEWAMVLGRRVDYLAPTIFLSDLLLLLTVGSWGLLPLVRWAQGISNVQFPISKQILRFKAQKFKTKYLWIVALIAFVVANISVAADQMVAIYKWLKVAEFVLLGWYIVRTKPPLATIIIPLSIGVFYSSVIAIGQLILQHSIGGPLWWFGERTFDVDTPGIARFDFNFSLFTFHFSLFGLRPYATFPHPNVLGGFLAAVLPLLLIRPIRPMNETMSKIFQWTTITLGMIALVLTFSRSAIVVGLIGMGISIWYEVFRKKPHRTFSNMLYVIPLILLSIMIVSTISIKEESVVVRQQLITAAVKLWATSPLFGVGWGNLLVRLPETLPIRTIYFLQPVHNIYLLALAETGMAGVLTFIWVLWKALSVKQESKKEREQKSGQVDAYIFNLPLYAFLLLGFVDHYPLTLQQGQLLFTVLAGMSVLSVH